MRFIVTRPLCSAKHFYRIFALLPDRRSLSRQRRRRHRAAVRLGPAELGPFDAQLEQQRFDGVGEEHVLVEDLEHVLVEDFQLLDGLNAAAVEGVRTQSQEQRDVDRYRHDPLPVALVLAGEEQG